MGMSTHIQALVAETDPEYLKHKRVLLACADAGVSLPKETAEYFGDDDPELSLLTDALTYDLIEGQHYQEFSDSSSQGFELFVDQLPKGVSKIRFYNSW